MKQLRTLATLLQAPCPDFRKACICLVAIVLSFSWGLFAGCGGPLIQVKRAQPPAAAAQDLPGVPFFTVGYRCLHTSVWLQPVYAVTLVISSDDKSKPFSPITQTKIFGRQELDAPCTAMAPCVRATLAKIQNNPQTADYLPFLNEFRSLPEMNPLTFDTTKILDPNSLESKEVLLSSNAVAPERYVDASAVYYYNVKKPWSGTANGEVDLTNEGILSKTSAQVEDKTLATILGVLPVSDLIKAAAGVKTTPPQTGPYKLDLQIQSRIYKHTRSAAVPGALPPCTPVTTPVGADGAPFNFTVEDVTASPTPPSSSAEKKTDTTKDTKKDDGSSK